MNGESSGLPIREIGVPHDWTLPRAPNETFYGNLAPKPRELPMIKAD